MNGFGVNMHGGRCMLNVNILFWCILPMYVFSSIQMFFKLQVADVIEELHKDHAHCSCMHTDLFIHIIYKCPVYPVFIYLKFSITSSIFSFPVHTHIQLAVWTVCLYLRLFYSTSIFSLYFSTHRHN